MKTQRERTGLRSGPAKGDLPSATQLYSCDFDESYINRPQIDPPFLRLGQMVTRRSLSNSDEIERFVEMPGTRDNPEERTRMYGSKSIHTLANRGVQLDLQMFIIDKICGLR